MDTKYSTLFSGEKEDSVQDVNLEVMRRMDDITLSNFCQTSLYYKGLCESIIWLERIRAVPGLSLLLPYRSHYKDLQDFYLNIRSDTQYVLMTYKNEKWRTIAVTDEIVVVYESLIEMIGASLGMNDDSPLEEILQAINEHENKDDFRTVAIMVRFNDVIDYNTLGNYIIFSTKPDLPNYFNPQILQYPLLTDKDVYAVVANKSDELDDHFQHLAERRDVPYVDNRIITDPTAIIPRYSVPPKYKAPSYVFAANRTFINYDIPSIRRAHSMEQNIYIYLNERKHPEIDQYELTWMQYGYILRTDEYDDGADGILLIDLGAIEMEPSTYVFAVTTTKIYSDSSYLVSSFFDQLVLTPEEHQRSLIENLQEIIMKETTKLYSFEDIVLVIRSMYDEE